jgi:hypothetical protein
MFKQQQTLSVLLVIMFDLAACGRMRDQPAPGTNGTPAATKLELKLQQVQTALAEGYAPQFGCVSHPAHGPRAFSISEE